MATQDRTHSSTSGTAVPVVVSSETLSVDEIAQILSTELHLGRQQIIQTLALLDDGNTIPFITRYRKEVTGSLEEVQIQSIADRSAALRALYERKLDVRRLIAAQDKLTTELDTALTAAATLQEVEDLYLPYRPKRKTRASVAREKGLAALADIILQQPEIAQNTEVAIEAYAQPFLNAEKGVDTSLEAYAGASDIVAEIVAEDANVRGGVRTVFFRQASVGARVATPEKIAEKDPNGVYQLYYEFNENVTRLVPHRVLALNRAEREEVLRVSVALPYEQVQRDITAHYPVKETSPLAPILSDALADGYKRLLAPAMEREVRVELTRQAEEHAINIFAANLRNLLLQPPLRGKKVLGIDPGFRTGCKLTVVDETGKYITSDTMYLFKEEEARTLVRTLLTDYGITVIAIGNGTASRETEQLVADLLSKMEHENKKIGYMIVNEAGASVYSTSEAAREEFPTLDATKRGTISIARRLQDPLAELVKIDPKAVGVGLYQHDVDQKELAAMLERVVVSCVNFAGVDLNSASSALLKHVSGINTRVANAIVKYREANGPFKKRQDLLKVSGLGPATFVQAAGFLKIANGEEPLDNTFIHPESYAATRALLALLPEGESKHAKPAERIELFRQRLKLQSSLSNLGRVKPQRGTSNAAGSEQAAWQEMAHDLNIGLPTLHDILENLEKPGLDPRDALPAPILRHDVLKMEDLQPGMLLQGTIRNVVDFGAFVDIGVKHDGLVHISELADGYVRDPLTVVAVGQVVQVRVLNVDTQRNRVQLSMRGIKSTIAAS